MGVFRVLLHYLVYHKYFWTKIFWLKIKILYPGHGTASFIQYETTSNTPTIRNKASKNKSEKNAQLNRGLRKWESLSSIARWDLRPLQKLTELITPVLFYSEEKLKLIE